MYMNDSEQYHTGRAAAYDSAQHLLGTLLHQCELQKRVPSPTELRQLQERLQNESLRAEDAAEKKRVESQNAG